jgi:hypothetical protein
MLTMPNGQTMSSIEFHFYEWCIIVMNLSSEDMDALTDKQFQALKEEFVEAYKTATVIDLKGE